MASYNVIGSATTVQVISSTTIIDAQLVTIEALPSHVRASITVPLDVWADNAGDGLLTPFRNVIEQVMGTGQVIAAAGIQTLDDTQLLADGIAWTVGYTPPGAPGGPLTVLVTTNLPTPVTSTTLLVDYLNATLEAVDAAYTNLQAAPSGG